jgi:hypothetical protein
MKYQKKKKRESKGLAYFKSGSYVLRETESCEVVYAYYVLRDGKYKRFNKVVHYQSSVAAYRAAQQSGLICTNDPRVFRDQA